MYFARKFTTIVAIVTLASAFIGVVPQGALADNNNGANLQTGGNGQGNNGCGNGNGGPNGTKDCDKNQKNIRATDSTINIGQDLSSQDFENIVSGTTSVISSKSAAANVVSTASPISVGGISTTAAKTQATATALKQVPTPSMLPGIVLLGACAIAVKVKTTPSHQSV